MKRGTLLLAASLLASTAAMPVHAQVKIGVITSATGPTAFVGIPQKNTVGLLPKRIGDLSVEYITYDDGSDSTQTVQLARKLLSEARIDAMIGPSGSPNAISVLQFLAEARTPMLATVGTAAVVLPMDDQKRWVFKTVPNDDVISERLVSAMTRRGVRTVGFIGYNDPYGDVWFRTFAPMAEKAGLKIVANERFSRTDTSVTGQALKLIAANPDALLIAGVAAGAALPHMQLVDAGYRGTIYHTHGSATGAFIKIGGAKVEGAMVVGPLLLVIDQVPDSVPTKKVALRFLGEYDKAFGSRPPIFGAATWDAGLLLQYAIPEAARKGKPGTPEFRAALRDALEAPRDLVTSQGVVNMTPEDHSGYDQRGSTLMTVKDGDFVLVSD